MNQFNWPAAGAFNPLAHSISRASLAVNSLVDFTKGQSLALNSLTESIRGPSLALNSLVGSSRVAASLADSLLGPSVAVRSLSDSLVGSSRVGAVLANSLMGVNAALYRAGESGHLAVGSVAGSLAWPSRVGSLVGTLVEPQGLAASLANSLVGPSVAVRSVSDSLMGYGRLTASLADSLVGPSVAVRSLSDSVVGYGRLTASLADSLVGPSVAVRSLSDSLVGSSRVALSLGDSLVGPSVAMRSLSNSLATVPTTRVNDIARSFYPTIQELSLARPLMERPPSVRTVIGMDEELWSALGRIGHEFQEMLHGAWFALLVRGPDWARHSTHSARELIDWVLRILAPDSTFTTDDLIEAGQKAVTRAMRVERILRGRAGPNSVARVRQQALTIHYELDAVAHTGTGTVGHVRGLLRLTEGLLLSLLGRRRLSHRQP